MYCRRFNATLFVAACLDRQKEAATPWAYRDESTSLGACYKCAQGRLAAAGKERDDDMEDLMKVAMPVRETVGTPISREILEELLRRIKRLRETMTRQMEVRPGLTA